MERSRPRWWRTHLLLAVPLVLVATVVAQPQASHTGQTGVRGTPWEAHIRMVEEALAKNDADGALRAWREAHLAALGSWRWDGMIAAGDAALRIGGVSGLRRAAEARARQAYLTAFFRARYQESLSGVLRSAEAFAALGDREVVEQCIAVAEQLAAQSGDVQAREQLRAFAARWAATSWLVDVQAVVP